MASGTVNSRPGPLQSLAGSARLSNVPGVLSNVSLGIVLGILETRQAIDTRFWINSATVGFAAAALYLSGNFLNDWADRNWDAIQRPERALPRRLFAPGLYLLLASGLLLSALGAASFADHRVFLIALTITICILLYTWLHKRTAWSVIPLALCRALLPLLGFAAIAGDGGIRFSLAAIASGLGLFCHITGLSLLARREAVATTRHPSLHPASAWFAPAALLSLSAARFVMDLPLFHCLAGLVPYLLWTTISLTFFRHSVSSQVSRLLAGIPLIDWLLLLPLFLSRHAQPSPPLIALACLCLPPLAVLAGKALQRFAPAT